MESKKVETPRRHYHNWQRKRPDLWLELRGKFKGSDIDFCRFEHSLFCIYSEVPHPFRPSQLKNEKKRFRSLAAQLVKLKETIEPMNLTEYFALENQLQEQARNARRIARYPSPAFSEGYADHVYAGRNRPFSAKALTAHMGMKVLPDDPGMAIASLEHIAMACQVLAKSYVPMDSIGPIFEKVERGSKQVIANSIKRIFATYRQKFSTSETGFAAHAFRALMSEYADSTDETTVQYWLKNAEE